ncbi:MAG: GAF domain-containing protein [Candidatus Omnitrophica bacterium]|nr:GAF domain-containing protein [Candidatus Omnitrophota bacterium]MCA9416561.1 GAF domain-containing protein [Candidatus Omnitrophota bacterium]MCA9425743.1 GAF domain-containing protein [Candidatus Omnitrophota bacterium]MCA9437698.1 GAF domain-containing protein [Candidatus Omnitrophota bacterium]MCA9440900.1 GAF domain-containing protein [Candidatus Omnitrophota bacterium]
MPSLQGALNSVENADRDHLVRLSRTFLRVEEIIDSVSDLQRLLDLIMRESEQVVDAETSSLLLFDHLNEELYFEIAHGPQGESVKTIRLPLDESSIAGATAIRRVPINIPDVRESRYWNSQVDKETDFQTRNLLAVPMQRQDRLIGVIEVLNKRQGVCFTEQDTDVLMVLASLAAIAIENAQLYEEKLQSERLAALGQAVAGISHYIKNVLTGLRGSMSLIDTAIQDHEYELLEKSMVVLRRSYGRIHHLVRDMLSYSKGREPNPRAVSPNEIILEIFDLMNESASSKDIEIVLDLDKTMPILWVDPDAMEGIVLNLITNAIDAVYERSLINPNPPGKIWITTYYAAETLTVCVRDNGTGISEAQQKRIWTAFYSTKGSSGTGLGLAVTRKVIEEAGGTLVLNSTLGSGSEFSFSLPAPPI